MPTQPLAKADTYGLLLLTYILGHRALFVRMLIFLVRPLKRVTFKRKPSVTAGAFYGLFILSGVFIEELWSRSAAICTAVRHLEVFLHDFVLTEKASHRLLSVFTVAQPYSELHQDSPLFQDLSTSNIHANNTKFLIKSGFI